MNVKEMVRRRCIAARAILDMRPAPFPRDRYDDDDVDDVVCGRLVLTEDEGELYNRIVAFRDRDR